MKIHRFKKKTAVDRITEFVRRLAVVKLLVDLAQAVKNLLS